METIYLVLRGDGHYSPEVEQAFTTKELADDYVTVAKQAKDSPCGNNDGELEIRPLVPLDHNPFRVVPTWSATVDEHGEVRWHAQIYSRLTDSPVYRVSYPPLPTYPKPSGSGESSVSLEDAIELARAGLRGEKVKEGQPVMPNLT